MLCFGRIGALTLAIIGVGDVFAQDLSITDDGSRVTIAERGQAVLGYVYRADPAAAPALSNYLHPLYGLYGEVLTGDAPSNWSGAPGVSWVWTRLGAEGRAIDLAAGEGGKRVFERVTTSSSVGDRASFGLQNVWITDPDGVAQVIENIAVTVEKATLYQRAIDLDIVLRAVSSAPVYLEGVIPGSGLNIQLSLERSDWSTVGAQGELRPNSAPYLSPWAVCSYRDDRRSTRSGFAILQDSRNPGFSQPGWQIEALDRLSAGIPETVKVELKPGQTLEFRYRFILYHLGGSKVDMTAEYAKFMSESQQR